MTPLIVLVLLCSTLLAGCGEGAPEAPGGASVPTAPPTPRADACAAIRPAPLAGRVSGLIFPRGTVVGKVTERADGATQVEGFIPMTPSGFLRSVERRRGIRVLFRENEGRESEALLSDGRRRNFWKVLAACPQGSKFVAVIIEEPDKAPGRP